MSFQNNPPSNSVVATSSAALSPKQPARALRRHESFLQLHSIPTTNRTTDVREGNNIQKNVTPTSGVPLERVPRCRDLWFEDGDVIIWAQDEKDSLLCRVHRRVLKESKAEPFCTVVNCDYPDPKTSDETFLDGVWVLKYVDQDPIDVMYVLKWMYERP